MNVNLDGLVGVLWTQLWQLTLLIPLAIAAVRFGCRGRSHLGYVVLLAVLVKCVVPPLWSSPAGVFSWASHVLGIGDESSMTAVDVEPVVPNQPKSGEPAGVQPSSPPVADEPPLVAMEPSPAVDADAAKNSPAEAGEQPAKPRGNPDRSPPPQTVFVDWGQVGVMSLLGFWLCGIVGVVGYLLAKRVYLERFHDDTRVEVQDELLSLVSECAVALDMRRHPDLVVTTHPTIPFVVGWWSPRLVIPKHIVDRSTTDDMRLIIAHELNHLRRWDTATNWFQLAIQALWWFHPFVWWLNAEIRRWRETCCDEEVVARLQCRPASYAHCLLNVLDFQASLKSTSGFDALSPFEVTKQRLHNIMQPVGPFPRSTPWSVLLAFVVLIIVVLPGAAFTLPSPVAEAHDEIPTAPLVAEEPAVPPPPPTTKAILPEHLQSVAPPVVAADPDPIPAPVPVVAQGSDWKYKFDVHRGYQYSVEIEEDGLRGLTRHTGQPVVHATYISGGDWSLQISPPELAAFEVPSPGRPWGAGFRPPRISGPFSEGYEVTIAPDGRVIDETGRTKLPLFLGSWSNWLFSPLPGRDRPFTWDEEGATTLSLMVEPTIAPFGHPDPSPFARPRESSRLAASTYEQTTQSALNGVLTLKRHRTVETQEQVDGEPRFRLQMDSTWRFDSRLGVPDSLVGTGDLTERRTNQSTKTPFKFTVQLVANTPADNAGRAGGENTAPAPQLPAIADLHDPSTGPGSVAPELVGKAVPADQKLERGQKFIVEWQGQWFPTEILNASEPDGVKIHYSGFSDHWDEVVPRSRIHDPAGSPAPSSEK